MFFILRCIFWLGLVFFNMDWSSGGSAAGPGRVDPLPAMHKVAATAGMRARDFCRIHASDCLGALIAASGTVDKVLAATRSNAATPEHPHEPPPAHEVPARHPGQREG